MRVKCVIDDLSQVKREDSRLRLLRTIKLEGPDRELKVGDEYVVQAVDRWSDRLNYYIHTIDNINCPTPYPAELFEIVDGTIPVGWCLHVSDGPLGWIPDHSSDFLGVGK